MRGGLGSRPGERRPRLLPSWRGRGPVTRAVLLASRCAAAEGGEEAVIQVDPENPASTAVARRAGFTPGEQPHGNDAARQRRRTVRPVRPGPARRAPVATGHDGTARGASWVRSGGRAAPAKSRGRWKWNSGTGKSGPTCRPSMAWTGRRYRPSPLMPLRLQFH
ncbi:GNAT family N-acetyltransferase [Streptomyces sp. NBC_00853]|uniref:GNAT family N-acetyltransferase n=1 Tax=Streptomyces sp. NBC_00853 TaxID=2903681 RepID=UPI003872EFE5